MKYEIAIRPYDRTPEGNIPVKDFLEADSDLKAFYEYLGYSATLADVDEMSDADVVDALVEDGLLERKCSPRKAVELLVKYLDDTLDGSDEFVFYIKNIDTGKYIYENDYCDVEDWIYDLVMGGDPDPDYAQAFIDEGWDYDFLLEMVEENFEESNKMNNKRIRENAIIEAAASIIAERRNRELSRKNRKLHEEKDSPRALFNKIKDRFPKNEVALARHFTDLLLDIKQEEDDIAGETSSYMQYYDDIGDLYDACTFGLPNLYRFLAAYFMYGLEEAMGECEEKEEFDETLKLCKKICPTLNEKDWIQAWKNFNK